MNDDELKFLVDTANVEPSDAEEIDDDLFSIFDEPEVTPTEEEPDTVDHQRILAARDCLEIGKPLFLIQRSHQHSVIIPELLDQISDSCGDAINLGVVAPLPRMRPSGPSGVHTFFRNTSLAPVQIADPECFARLDSYGQVLKDQREGQPYAGPSTASKWRFFNEDLPTGWTAEWVSQVIQIQREQGATVLLTPGTWLDPADRAGSLRALRDDVSWSRDAIRAHENLAVNITISPAWLTSAPLLQGLLAEILDLDESIFYLRVRWPLLVHPYGQLTSPDILDGYVELANVCQENDKFLILPNTGLTGWAAIGWGANGFSSGIGSGERAFSDTKVIKMKRTGPRPAPTNRIFRNDLLHVVDTNTDALLSGINGRGACQCAFCRSQTPGSWDKAKGSAHYLLKLAELTGQTAQSRNARVATRSTIRQARDFRDAASGIVPLTAANDPKHLDLWLERLR